MSDEKMNLLVIDWDYFFPTPEGKEEQSAEEFFLYDWGHSEGFGPLNDALWVDRAAAFKINNVARPQMNLEWTDGWWERFNIDPRATLFYADSNVQAMEADPGMIGQVWLYDAHHDSGYTRSLEEIVESGKVSCEDWMVAYHLRGAELHVRYPRWKPWAMTAEQGPSIEVDRQVDDFAPNPVEFHSVFVCRSGAWVPPWADQEFWDFITDAPVNELYEVGPEYKAREWDEAWIDQKLEIWQALRDFRENPGQD
jgi:hypothetical protein